MRILNKSRNELEQAKQMQCPRCKGHGSNLGDIDGCFLCNGFGTLWMAKSGWTRALWARADQTQLW